MKSHLKDQHEQPYLLLFYCLFSFQVKDIQEEAITVECFIPITEDDLTRFYLEDEVTIHGNRVESFACPMTKVYDYTGTNVFIAKNILNIP